MAKRLARDGKDSRKRSSPDGSVHRRSCHWRHRYMRRRGGYRRFDRPRGALPFRARPSGRRRGWRKIAGSSPWRSTGTKTGRDRSMTSSALSRSAETELATRINVPSFRRRRLSISKLWPRSAVVLKSRSASAMSPETQISHSHRLQPAFAIAEDLAEAVVGQEIAAREVCLNDPWGGLRKNRPQSLG